MNTNQTTPVDMESLLSSDDIFSQKLAVTTPITEEILEVPVWGLISKFNRIMTPAGRPSTYHKLLALVCNAAITHQQTEFLLSANLVNALIVQDKNIQRAALAGSEYKAFMAKAKAAGVLLEIEKPVKSEEKKERKAGLYRLNIKQISEFIDNIATSDVTSPFISPSTSCEIENEIEIEGEIKNAQAQESPLNPSNDAQAPLGLAKEEKGSSFLLDANDDDERPYQPGDEYIPKAKFAARIKLAEEKFVTFANDLPSIGSSNASFENFSLALNELIDDCTVPLFNRWDDQCGYVMPPSLVIKGVIEDAFNKRFKDKSGLWSFDGEIAQRALALVNRRLPEKSNPILQVRHCSPKEWHKYQEVEKIQDLQFNLKNDFEFFNFLMSDEDKELAKKTISDADQATYEKVKAANRQHYESKIMASMPSIVELGPVA